MAATLKRIAIRRQLRKLARRDPRVRFDCPEALNDLGLNQLRAIRQQIFTYLGVLSKPRA